MRSADLSEQTSNLGPGSYNVEVREMSPSFSIQPKHNEKAEVLSPGPGQYQPEVSQTKSRTQITTFSKTSNVKQSEQISGPSAVTYDYKRFYNYGEHGPEHSIAPKRQAKEPKGSPGPGEYEAPSAFKKKK